MRHLTRQGWVGWVGGCGGRHMHAWDALAVRSPVAARLAVLDGALGLQHGTPEGQVHKGNICRQHEGRCSSGSSGKTQ